MVVMMIFIIKWLGWVTMSSDFLGFLFFKMEKGLSLYVHNGSAAGGGVWRQKKCNLIKKTICCGVYNLFAHTFSNSLDATSIYFVRQQFIWCAQFMRINHAQCYPPPRLQQNLVCWCCDSFSKQWYNNNGRDNDDTKDLHRTRNQLHKEEEWE